MLRFAYPLCARAAAVAGFSVFAASSALAQNGYDPYATSPDPYQGSSSGYSSSLFSSQPISSAAWVVTLSANGTFSPNFRGAKEMTFTPYPMLGISRGGSKRRPDIPGDSFSFDLLDSTNFSLGPVARYQPGRYRSDDLKLFGLRKNDWTLQGGAYIEFWPSHNFRARVEGRHGFRDEDGWVVDFAADFVQTIDRLTMTLGPRARWNSNKEMNHRYGVTLSEAATHNLVFPNHAVYAYKPESGFESAGAAASVSYQFTDQWKATATAGYDRLIGDAGRSPIVRRIGDRNQYTFGLKAAYSFGLN